MTGCIVHTFNTIVCSNWLSFDERLLLLFVEKCFNQYNPDALTVLATNLKDTREDRANTQRLLNYMARGLGTQPTEPDKQNKTNVDSCNENQTQITLCQHCFLLQMFLIVIFKVFTIVKKGSEG